MNTYYLNINDKNNKDIDQESIKFINLYKHKNDISIKGIHNNIIHNEILYFENKTFLESDYIKNNELIIIDLSDRNTFNNIINYIKSISYDKYVAINNTIIYINNILFFGHDDKNIIINNMKILVNILNENGIDGYFIHSGLMINSEKSLNSHIQYTNMCKNNIYKSKLYEYLMKL